MSSCRQWLIFEDIDSDQEWAEIETTAVPSVGDFVVLEDVKYSVASWPTKWEFRIEDGVDETIATVYIRKVVNDE